jgi:hypothetical protein
LTVELSASATHNRRMRAVSGRTAAETLLEATARGCGDAQAEIMSGASSPMRIIERRLPVVRLTPELSRGATRAGVAHPLLTRRYGASLRVPIWKCLKPFN